MDQLKITLEPREEDLREWLACPPNGYEPGDLGGKATIWMKGKEVSFGTLHPGSYDERGSVPLVQVADFMEFLLSEGLRSLRSRRGKFRVYIVEDNGLVLRPTSDTIKIGVFADLRPYGDLLSELRLRKPQLLLSDEVNKRDFAEALISEAESLMERFGSARPDLLREDGFWRHFRGRVQNVHRWLAKGD